VIDGLGAAEGAASGLRRWTPAELDEMAAQGHALPSNAWTTDPLPGAQAALQAKQAVEATEAARTAATLRQQGSITQQVAQADAASGRTVGSALGTLFRHSVGAPQEALGHLGAGVEDALSPLFGTRGAGLARTTAEGMAVG